MVQKIWHNFCKFGYNFALILHFLKEVLRYSDEISSTSRVKMAKFAWKRFGQRENVFYYYSNEYLSTSIHFENVRTTSF